MDLNYEKQQNFNIIKSDDDEVAAEFSMINPDLLDLYLEDSHGVSNAPGASAIVDNLLLPSEQFYEFCSHLNEDQNYLFNFMKYVTHHKLAEKNNELQPKPSHIFLSGGASVEKSLVTAKA